jgi:DNA-binding GntR family transcriptional regulator
MALSGNQDISPKNGERSAVPSERQSLADIAYEGLKRKILTLEFEPGSYLNESHIAETLDIGRNPVHNAVKRLVFEGMIDVMPRKGMIVRPLNLREVLEIAEARLVNEAYCVRCAAERASARDIAEMRKILTQSRRALKERDVEAQMFLDRDFHCTIFKAARNSVLEEMLRLLHERSLRTWFVSLKEPAQAKAVLQQHTDVLSAIESRDSDAAELEMRRHIEASRDSLQRLV